MGCKCSSSRSPAADDPCQDRAVRGRGERDGDPHSGDPRLARHIGNAAVRTDNRGTRIYKEHKHSTRRIDLAVCAIMAQSVAAMTAPGPPLYWYAADRQGDGRSRMMTSLMISKWCGSISLITTL
jgi:hypothetical protein